MHSLQNTYNQLVNSSNFSGIEPLYADDKLSSLDYCVIVQTIQVKHNIYNLQLVRRNNQVKLTIVSYFLMSIFGKYHSKQYNQNVDETLKTFRMVDKKSHKQFGK